MGRKSLKQQLHEAFSGQFMSPEITEKQKWFIVGDWEGVYPSKFFGLDWVKTSHPDEKIETLMGYGARLSAPGYLDCTDWGIFSSKREAMEYLIEMYGSDY